MKSHIHFDEHVQHSPRTARRIRPLPRDLHIVDDEREGDAPREREDPRGIDRMKWIGQPDVGDSGIREDFRLTQFGAADADGATLELQTCDSGRLVGFRVRPQPHAGGRRHLLDAIEVGEKARTIDDDLRRWKIGQTHPII
jgi:hypothetical protein